MPTHHVTLFTASADVEYLVEVPLHVHVCTVALLSIVQMRLSLML